MDKDQKLDKGKMDNPDQIKTDKKSLYDMFEEEQTVDSIPLEDQKIEQEGEKQENHRKTQDDSSSEQKFPG